MLLVMAISIDGVVGSCSERLFFDLLDFVLMAIAILHYFCNQLIDLLELLADG